LAPTRTGSGLGVEECYAESTPIGYRLEPRELRINTWAILVVVQPAAVSAMSARLDALPGLEVHQVDPPTGRLISTARID